MLLTSKTKTLRFSVGLCNIETVIHNALKKNYKTTLDFRMDKMMMVRRLYMNQYKKEKEKQKWAKKSPSCT